MTQINVFHVGLRSNTTGYKRTFTQLTKHNRSELVEELTAKHPGHEIMYVKEVQDGTETNQTQTSSRNGNAQMPSVSGDADQSRDERASDHKSPDHPHQDPL